MGADRPGDSRTGTDQPGAEREATNWSTPARPDSRLPGDFAVTAGRRSGTGPTGDRPADDRSGSDDGAGTDADRSGARSGADRDFGAGTAGDGAGHGFAARWNDAVQDGDHRDPARPDGVGPGTYQEDATEVIGPFDIGSWTLQSQEGGPVLDRRRSRPEQPRLPVRATWERPPRDPRPVGRARDDDEEPVTAGVGSLPSTRSGDRVRTVVRGVGQTLLTLGIVLLLLATYEVWFTDVVNDRTQARLKTELEQEWQTGDDPVVAAQKTGRNVRSIPLGDGFALIYIPDFGTDYVYTIVEGTGTDELNEGPGHYVDTPLPGAVGNVAIAGHRVGKGSPFLNLDKLKAGSAIVIRTKTYWYTYRVLGDARTGDPRAVGAFGVPGLEIVDPSTVGVLYPVPNKPGVRPTRRLLTLTTCHPKFSARERLVIHAQLAGSPRPTSAGLPPALAGG